MEDLSCQRPIGFKRVLDEKEHFPPTKSLRSSQSEFEEHSPALGIEVTYLDEDVNVPIYCVIEVNKKVLPDESEKLVSKVISEKTLPKIFRRKLSLGEVLGRGAFGEVHRGTLTLRDGEVVEVAIKQMNALARKFSYEALLLQDMGGVGGVPRLYGVVRGRKPAIVMEYIEGDTLQHALEGSHLHDTFGIFVAFCDALQELHDAGFSHGDLHYHNALCQRDSEGKVRCRIIDVGLASRVFDPTEFDDDEYFVSSFALRCCQVFAKSEEIERLEGVVHATPNGPHLIGTLREAASALLQSVEGIVAPLPNHFFSELDWS